MIGLTLVVFTNQIVKQIKRVLSQGFLHLFGATVLNKASIFVLNIALVWLLSKEEFGLFSYTNNIFAFMQMLTGFGLVLGMFQFCAERHPESKKDSVLRYALITGVLVDVGIVLIACALCFIVPFAIADTGTYLVMLAPVLVLDYLFLFLSMFLRSRKQIKEYSALQLLNTVLYMGLGSFGTWLFGIEGTIAGRYVAYVVSILCGLLLLKKLKCLNFVFAAPLTHKERRSLWHYSIPSQIASALGQLTFVLDIFFLGLFASSADVVAEYRVAVIIPEGMLFLPACIAVFAMPYFAENNGDKEWLVKHSSALIKVAVGVFAAITAVLLIFAYQIVGLLWGDAYVSVVPIFRILSICFLFAALKSVFSNLLAALRRVRENFIISLIAVGVNIFVCLLTIPRLGAYGAAFAPLVTAFAACVTSVVVLIRYLIRLKGHTYAQIK